MSALFCNTEDPNLQQLVLWLRSSRHRSIEPLTRRFNDNVSMVRLASNGRQVLTLPGGARLLAAVVDDTPHLPAEVFHVVSAAQHSAVATQP